ncbi:MAG: hypothetical protein HZA61_12585 [Candidatus Eisenbacteria bacterium]|uniref:Uncharacterized protein n=1 Tax=Eiseniibacteriota bacterium TaxID=2212470 RepID=A0A933SDV6_UNCEI|nr:hypothetical protein [Candidatus Eisenbacteria bacterium]
MHTTYPDQSAAFSALERRLAERRWRALDGRSRAVFAALTALLSGFFFWQARVPLDGWVRSHGTLGGAQWLAVAMAAWALVAGALAAWRQDALATRVPGSEWLALPVDPARVMRHLLGESRLPAFAVIPPALATLVAGAGLVPAWWLALLAAFFALAWIECTRLAAAAARAIAARRSRHAALPAPVRLLASARQAATAKKRRAPRWRAEGGWRALQRLDLTLTRTPGPAQPRMASALALVGVSLAMWFAAAEPLQRRALAFAAFLPAATALGAWAITRTCGDPAAAMRPLPLSLADTWRARFVTLAAVLGAALVANALLAAGLPLGARFGIVLTWSACGLAVAALGLQYGLTLHPRALAAENLYFGWLGVTLMASWMIPLLGWIVLAAGLVHSGVRLRRWWTSETA